MATAAVSKTAYRGFESLPACKEDMTYTKKCPECLISYETLDSRRKFCSKSCASSNTCRGRTVSQEIRQKIAEASKRQTNRARGAKHSEAVGNSTRGKYKGHIESIAEVSSRTARKILKRLGLGCSKCGWNEAVGDIHHIHGRKIQNANAHINLTYICPNCHRMVHEGKLKPEDLVSLSEFLPSNWRDAYYG